MELEVLEVDSEFITSEINESFSCLFSDSYPQIGLMSPVK
jgi:hypothetical protein